MSKRNPLKDALKITAATALLITTGCTSTHIGTVEKSTYKFRAVTINHYGAAAGTVGGAGVGFYKSQGKSASKKTKEVLKDAGIGLVAGMVVDEFLPNNKEYKMDITYYVRLENEKIKKFRQKLENGIFLNGEEIALDTMWGLPYAAAGDISITPEKAKIIGLLQDLEYLKNVEAHDKSYRYRDPNKGKDNSQDKSKKIIDKATKLISQDSNRPKFYAAFAQGKSSKRDSYKLAA